MTSPRVQNTEGMMGYALLTGAFEMGDPFIRFLFDGPIGACGTGQPIEIVVAKVLIVRRRQLIIEIKSLRMLDPKCALGHHSSSLPSASLFANVIPRFKVFRKVP